MRAKTNLGAEGKGNKKMQVCRQPLKVMLKPWVTSLSEKVSRLCCVLFSSHEGEVCGMGVVWVGVFNNS